MYVLHTFNMTQQLSPWDLLPKWKQDEITEQSKLPPVPVDCEFGICDAGHNKSSNPFNSAFIERHDLMWGDR